MNPQPMLLETHYFTKVAVEANPSYRPKENEEELGGVQTEVQLAQHQDDPRRWQVILNIRTVAADETNLPYKIDLQAVGFFEIGPEVEEQRRPKIVHANGAAILYSSAREFLLLITGRGPWPALYLPTTNFLKPTKLKDDNEGEPTPPVPQTIKKKRTSKTKSATD